jgi:hypothetical protein
VPIQGVAPSSLPLRSGILILLLLFDLVPVPEKLSSRMSVIAWFHSCLQSLRIPQVNKELLSRVFTSSKEPLLVPDLGVLDNVGEVRDSPSFHLDSLERNRPVVFQPKVEVPVKLDL